MSYLYILIFALGILQLNKPLKENKCKNSKYILAKSIQKHDPHQQWRIAELAIHIQEPRAGNPLRNSKIILNNASGYFLLERERQEGVIQRIIEDNNTPKILLNGDKTISESIRDKYNLYVERNVVYKTFYQMMYGLPMSVTEELRANIRDAEAVLFEEEKVYVIPIELKESIISKNWELIISRKDYSIRALRIIHPEDPDAKNEIIAFDGEFSWNEITIPRFRHWYLQTGQAKEYLVSDIIVEELN